MEDGDSLSPDEGELLRCFRALKAEDQAAAIGALATMARRSGRNADVGQIKFERDDRGAK